MFFWHLLSISQLLSGPRLLVAVDNTNIFQTSSSVAALSLAIEGLLERTKHLDIFLIFRPSLNGVLFSMFCLLVEGECQIFVF